MVVSKRIEIPNPDLISERGNKYLFVWGDVPCWTVGDQEMKAFLEDNTPGFEDRCSKFGLNLKEQKQLMKQFLLIGIIPDSDTKQKSETKIENISINLTNKCNLRCRFCYNKSSLSNCDEGELNADEIISFIKEAEKHAIERPSLALLGGEPLEVRDRLIKVVKYAKKRKMSVLVSSNGTLVDKEFAREAKRLKLDVQVSLDGPTPECNDQVRGKGSFDKIINGIEILAENGVYTIISMVCHEGNLDLLEDYYKLGVRLGVDEVRFIPLKKLGAAVDGELKPVAPDILMEKASNLLDSNREYQRLAGRDAFSILANTCRYSTKKASCGTGLQTLLLDADGALYPCLNTNSACFKLGNIRDNDFSFDKLWNDSEQLKDYRKQTCIDNPEKKCARCAFRYWCLGGCQGENYKACGDFTDRPAACAQNKKSIQNMLWILSENPKWIKTFSSVC